MRKTVFMLAALVVFAACSKDDPTEPNPQNPTNDKYFGTPNGSFWVYSNDSIALDGGIHPLNKFDTLRQLQDTNFLGLNAKLMEHYFHNLLTGLANTSKYFMYESGSKVYVSKEFFRLFMPDMLVNYFDGLPDTVKIADGNVMQWNLAEIDAPDLDLSIFPDIPAIISKISGKFKIGFTRGDNAEKYGYNTNLFTMKVVFAGNLETALPIPVPFETSFSEIDFYFSTGKGLIEVVAKPMTIKASVTVLGTPIEYPLMSNTGFKKTLTATNVD
jgi:hypothetical protein